MTFNEHTFSNLAEIVNGYADFFKSVYLTKPEDEAESYFIITLSTIKINHFNIIIREIK